MSETLVPWKRDQISRSATLPPTPSSKTVSSVSSLKFKSRLPMGGSLRSTGGRATFKKQGGAQTRRLESMREGDISQAIRKPNQSSQIPNASFRTAEGPRTIRDPPAPTSLNSKCTREKSTGQWSTAKTRSSELLPDAMPAVDIDKFAETIPPIAEVRTDNGEGHSRKVRAVKRERTRVGSQLYTRSWSENDSSEDEARFANCGQKGSSLRITSSKAKQESNKNHTYPGRKPLSGMPLCSRSKDMAARLIEPHIFPDPNVQIENERSTFHGHTSKHQRTESDASPSNHPSNSSTRLSSLSAPKKSSSSTSALHSVTVTPKVSTVSSLPVRPPIKALLQHSNDISQTRERNTLAPQEKDPERTCEQEPVDSPSCTLSKSLQKNQDHLASNRHASGTLLRVPKTFKASFPASEINTGSSRLTKNCILAPTSASHNQPPAQSEVVTVSNPSINTRPEVLIEGRLFTGLRETTAADNMRPSVLTSNLKEGMMADSPVAKRDSGTFLTSSKSSLTLLTANAPTVADASSHTSLTGRKGSCIVHPNAATTLASVCSVQESLSISTPVKMNGKQSTFLRTFHNQIAKEEYLISFLEKSMDPPSSPLPPRKTAGVAMTDSEPRDRRHMEIKFLDTLRPSKLPLLFDRSNPKAVSLSGRPSGNLTSATNRIKAERMNVGSEDCRGGNSSGDTDPEPSAESSHTDSKDEDKEILRCPSFENISCIQPSVRLVNGNEKEICVEDNRHHSFPPLANPNTPSPAPESGYVIQKEVRYRRKESEPGTHEMEAGKGNLATRLRSCTDDEEVRGRHVRARCCIIL